MKNKKGEKIWKESSYRKSDDVERTKNNEQVNEMEEKWKNGGKYK